jgi:S-adenosyl-L-methionine hydrolase (adenosine-forming)
VLARRVPSARVVELTSELPARAISESAFLLSHMASGFPAGTIHIAVVDPGVGGDRAPIAIRCPEGSYLVGPDNGLLAPLAERLGGGNGFRIDRRKVGGPSHPSVTFDGRDLFAPAAALLARGRPVRGFATPTRYRPSPVPVARREGTRMAGSVLHVDRFGNLITNVPSEWASGASLWVELGGRPRRRLPVVRTYAELPERGLGVLASSFGTLEVSGRDLRASGHLRTGVGAVVRFAPVGRPSKYPGR